MAEPAHLFYPGNLGCCNSFKFSWGAWGSKKKEVTW